MALTYTPEAQSDLKLPEFTLPATDGTTWSSKDLLKDNQPVVIMFICNHCPYVQAIEERLVQLGRDYANKVQFAAICSNDPADYPEDSFENLKAKAEELNFPFPYLHDESQSVAKSFDAVCTPDLYIFDSKGSLAYRGRLDDSWKDAGKVTKKELQLALDMILEGKQIPPAEQNPSMGCSIKWKDA